MMSIWNKKNCSSSIFHQMFNLIPFISSNQEKPHRPYVFEKLNKNFTLYTSTRKTKISSYKRWREKQNCHIC